jgi:sugar phosphate isomerase/epimerase
VEKWPIGVFTSIDAGLGIDLDVVKDLMIPTVQIHAPSPDNRNSSEAKQILQRLEEHGVNVTAVFGGFDGESYQDIPTVERTVGLVPKSTRAARLAEMKQISDFSKSLGCDVIALHLGFVPHDEQSAAYQEVVEVTRELCKYCAANGQSLHLETGQETAVALIQFIDDTDCENLFVNFDPANMILYGTGEPIAALKAIGDRVRSVHLKDANWSDNPGQTWGQEVPLGEGAVDILLFLNTLLDVGYAGPLTIEREIPQEPARQLTEIGRAVTLLNDLKAKLLT